MKPLLVANWKMNPGSAARARSMLVAVSSGLRRLKGLDVVVAPPFPYLSLGKSLFKNPIALGAQDVAPDPKGAFTGEVSAGMLKDARVRYVIIGHSERRRFFGETDVLINRKMKMAMAEGLRPILAIGDDTPDSEDVVPRVLAEQLSAAISGIPKQKLRSITVAYEPVWAIGTGNADTPDNATRRAIYIRKLIVKLAGPKIASSVRILYGGSVTSKNAASFLASDIRGMDGLLVGGGSLDPAEFISIARSIAPRRQ